MHRTWTGDSFHIWYYTCFNAILPHHPTLSLSHKVQKTVLYICVFFDVSLTGLSLKLSWQVISNRGARVCERCCDHSTAKEKHNPCQVPGPRQTKSGARYSVGLEYHWVSLVAQRLKHLPPMQETWVQSLGWEDPLEKEMKPTPVLLPGESHGWRNLVGCSLQGCKESDMTEQLHFLSFTFLHTFI